MRTDRRFILAVAALPLLLCVAVSGGAQTLFERGQNVQPVYEGWMRNPDGSFTMVFGYLNRNYVEEPHIPIGPANAFEPGPADRGQPTHFYPRRQQFLFEVVVPRDWGQKDLTWTLTHNGRTSTAIGSLLPAAEIDEGVYKVNRNSGGNHGRTSKVLAPNARPTVRVVGETAAVVTLPETLTLTVSANDDGKPGPRPATQRSESAAHQPAIPVDPLVLLRQGGPIGQDLVKARASYETGLAITWLHYRGGGKVVFEPQVVPIPLKDGTATTVVRFSSPGTYVVRAVADDGVLKTSADVTVVVKEGK
jgi:hypothetical protein